MGDGVLDAIETEVALLMRRAESTRRAAPDAAHRALDRAAYLILRRLAAEGPANVNGIALALGLDGSTVTRQVSALEGEGLVRRVRDPADGRAILVEPTRTGLARMAAVRRARQDVYAKILAGWSPADRAQLATLLGRLNADLDAYNRSPLS